MYIKQLSAKNFRNYKNLDLEFINGINFITGWNAVGKSNILEAISITSNIKSFRNVPDSEIIQWGNDSYYCSSQLGDARGSKFEIGFSTASGQVKKKAKIDGIEKRRLSEYYGKFLTVIFSPEDINIISGPPETRRKFFDGIISKVDEGYLRGLSDFKRVLVSRNKVLKDLNEQKEHSSAELDVWDRMFSEKASEIINKRGLFLEKFRNFFEEAYLGMSPGDSPPHLRYYSSFGTGKGEDILRFLKERRKRDIWRGTTTRGPHRDDYIFDNQRDVLFKNYASQGQKRSVSISLRISESRFIEDETGEAPVILIDDVFSELDEDRRNNLLENAIRKKQTIITSVNADLIKKNRFDNFIHFFVEKDGTVSRV